MTTFEELGVSTDLVARLATGGIDAPFPIQELTIPDALAGRDICGKAKTGSGKTLAFGLPLLDRVGKAEPRCPTGLVLVPTRELANQVYGVLKPLGPTRNRRVCAVYGGVGFEPQIDALRSGVDVVVGTPGRLIDLMQRGEVKFDNVEVLVLDEADRMADMGFMPQVQKILYTIESEHQTMLFSATLDGAVKRLVERYIREPVFHEVGADEVTVDEMDHRFLFVHDLDRVKVVAAITAGVQRTLVFCNTKRGADRLVTSLRREGVRAAAIHGDLRQQARERALADFSAGKVPVLVATDVAARHPRRRGRRRHPLRPGRRRQDVPPPVGPHRPRRRERRRRHADALEPGEHRPHGPAAPRPEHPVGRGVLQRSPPGRSQVVRGGRRIGRGRRRLTRCSGSGRPRPAGGKSSPRR